MTAERLIEELGDIESRLYQVKGDLERAGQFKDVQPCFIEQALRLIGMATGAVEEAAEYLKP